MMNGTEACDRLNLRLQTILPQEYQDSYESLQPVSMGSAGLKYDNDGRVAWDRDLGDVLRPRHGRRATAQRGTPRAGIEHGRGCRA